MNKNVGNIFERHPRKTIFCFLAAAIFIVDLLSAATYRFFNGYPWANRKEEQQIRMSGKLEKAYRIQSAFYHHDLAAKKAIYKTVWGADVYNVYTNSLGFRDRSTRDVSLASGRYRIVFIGDSSTEGLGVNYEYTFTGLVDAALSKKGIEVLNAGVTSYSPIIYWRKTKYLIENVGLKLDELVVFIDISDAEDEALGYCLDKNEKVVLRDARRLVSSNLEPVSLSEKYHTVLFKRLKTSIRENSILAYTVGRIICDIIFPKEKPAQNYTPTLQRTGWTIDNKLYQEYGEQGLREMRIYMDKLYDLLNKNNVKLTVAVYPCPTQIIYNDLNSI